MTVQADVSREEDVIRLVETVMKEFGRIDILINDAAYNTWVAFPIWKALTLEIWQKILQTNTTGPFLLMRAIGPIMKRQGRGRIVNIGSIAGFPAGRIQHRLFGLQGRPHPPDPLHGRGPGAGSPGELRGPRIPGRHAHVLQSCAPLRRKSQKGGPDRQSRRKRRRDRTDPDLPPHREHHRPDRDHRWGKVFH